MVKVDKLKLDLAKEFTSFRKSTKKEIDDLTSYMVKLDMLADNQNVFYKKRQELVSKRFEKQNLSAELVKERTRMERLILRAFKFGESVPGFEDNLLNAKNDFERKIFMRNYMKDIEYIISIIDNFIQFCDNSVKTLDDMTFGIKWAVELEQYRSHKIK